MKLFKLVLVVLYIVLLAVPVLLRPSEKSPQTSSGLQLVIMTPHNEQIRYEFDLAFRQWHKDHFGQNVDVVWLIPGGSSDIRNMLEAQYRSALESGKEPGGTVDLFFGGGQYEHDRLKNGISARVNGIGKKVSISQPLNLDKAWLKEVYGRENAGDNPGENPGENPLYDPDLYWLGTALSSFGIIWNNDLLMELDVKHPEKWDDLAQPDLYGWLALGNPAQSGSIRTIYNTILQHKGWVEGWKILRRLGANAHNFAASSSTVPINVSMGDAAAGVCIDFYGRFQAQSISENGDTDRLSYFDPPEGNAVIADPISMLRGAPNPETAERFIKFCLTEQAQSLWQFSVDELILDTLGPKRFELRRMPITKSLYENHIERFIDQIDPFAISASDATVYANYWGFIPVIFNSIVIDNFHELNKAWQAIITHPAYPTTSEIVSAYDVTDPVLRKMLELFDEMPVLTGPDEAIYSLKNEAQLWEIEAGWLGGKWKELGLWHEESLPEVALRRILGDFFSDKYRNIIDLAASS